MNATQSSDESDQSVTEWTCTRCNSKNSLSNLSCNACNYRPRLKKKQIQQIKKPAAANEQEGKKKSSAKRKKNIDVEYVDSDDDESVHQSDHELEDDEYVDSDDDESVHQSDHELEDEYVDSSPQAKHRTSGAKKKAQAKPEAPTAGQEMVPPQASAAQYKFQFTGKFGAPTRLEKIKASVRECGHDVSNLNYNPFDPKCTHLVCGDNFGKAKVRKAKKLGITILMNLNHLLDVLNEITSDGLRDKLAFLESIADEGGASSDDVLRVAEEELKIMKPSPQVIADAEKLIDYYEEGKGLDDLSAKARTEQAASYECLKQEHGKNFRRLLMIALCAIESLPGGGRRNLIKVPLKRVEGEDVSDIKVDCSSAVPDDKLHSTILIVYRYTLEPMKAKDIIDDIERLMKEEVKGSQSPALQDQLDILKKLDPDAMVQLEYGGMTTSSLKARQKYGEGYACNALLYLYWGKNLHQVIISATPLEAVTNGHASQLWVLLKEYLFVRVRGTYGSVFGLNREVGGGCSGMMVPIKVVHSDSGNTVMAFLSITAAATLFGVSYPTLSNQTKNGPYRIKGFRGLEARRLDETEHHVNVTTDEHNKLMLNKYRSHDPQDSDTRSTLFCLHDQSGQCVTTIRSLSFAAEALGLPVGYVERCREKGVPISRGKFGKSLLRLTDAVEGAIHDTKEHIEKALEPYKSKMSEGETLVTIKLPSDDATTERDWEYKPIRFYPLSAMAISFRIDDYDEEVRALVKGVLKHGRKWKQIYNDESLGLPRYSDNRKGALHLKNLARDRGSRRFVRLLERAESDANVRAQLGIPGGDVAEIGGDSNDEAANDVADC